MDCSGEVRSNLYRVLRARLNTHPLSHVRSGLITGVADDDPSGIATYSQAGAQFGLEMLRTMSLTFPLMAAMQSMCANMGRVTGKGLTADIKDVFPPIMLHTVVLLLLIANTLNIAADVAAIGEVAELASGIGRHGMTALVVFGTLTLQMFIPYHRYVFFLKWLTALLLAYAVALFTAHVPWNRVALHTVQPSVRLDVSTASTVVAMFGTTTSPYLFFRQAPEEVEGMQACPSLKAGGAKAHAELRRTRWDTWNDMLYSNMAAYFIIPATGMTLRVSGVTDVTTTAQAASALRPLVGDLAYVLFTVGILGVGLIGVPVLAGSGVHTLSEAMGWKEGLERKVSDIRGFYSIIAFSVLAGLAIQCSPIRPMKALFWSAVINGVVAVPLIAVIILLVSKPAVMGPYTASRPLIAPGWSATAVVGTTAMVMFLLQASAYKQSACMSMLISYSGAAAQPPQMAPSPLLHPASSAHCCPKSIPTLNARPEETNPSDTAAGSQPVPPSSLDMERYSENHRQSLRRSVRISSVPFGRSSELIIDVLGTVTPVCREMSIYCYLRLQHKVGAKRRRPGTVQNPVRRLTSVVAHLDRRRLRLSPYQHTSRERGCCLSGRPRDTHTHVLTQGYPDGLYATCGPYRKFKSWICALRNSTRWLAIGAEVYKMCSNRIAQLCDVMPMIVTLTGGCAGMSRRGTGTAIGAGVGGMAGAALAGGSAVGTVSGAIVGGVVGNQVRR